MSKAPKFDEKISSLLNDLKPGERSCSVTDEKWSMTQEEIDWYKIFQVPPSRLGLYTRMKLNKGFDIGYQWWYHEHPETGKQIIAPIHPATGFSVIPDNEWHEKDFSEVSKEIDLNESVFSQINSLQKQIPLRAWRNVQEPENSIALASGGDRNSYFVLACESEDSLYSIFSSRLSQSSEVINSDNTTASFSVTNSKNVSNSNFVRDCADIVSSSFTFLSSDLEYCFGATGQRHKKYIFFNEQLTKEEYESRMAEIDLSCADTLKEYFMRFHKMLSEEIVWPANLNARVQNCTGEYLYDCERLTNCYGCAKNCSNLFYTAHAIEAKDCAFTSGAIYSENTYYSNSIIKSSDIKMSFGIHFSSALEYCIDCSNCENCFGCVGLNRKKFHIFNKEYTEEEYWKKVDELKCAMLDSGEYGEFFSLNMSPYFFGQSGSVLYYGSGLDLAKKLGAPDYDPTDNGAIGDLMNESEMNTLSDIPSCSDELGDDWAGAVIYDDVFKRRYAMIQPEIQFYRKKGIAPPRGHFINRIIKLHHQTNLGVFENRACEKCEKEVSVAKNVAYPNRRIYCVECYYKHIETLG